jgi:hypothetical protein
MRLSINEHDVAHIPHTDAGRFITYCDGIRQRYVRTADEDRGYVVKCKLDDDGKVMIDRRRFKVVNETVYGHVVIVNCWQELDRSIVGARYDSSAC